MSEMEKVFRKYQNVQGPLAFKSEFIHQFEFLEKLRVHLGK